MVTPTIPPVDSVLLLLSKDGEVGIFGAATKVEMGDTRVVGPTIVGEEAKFGMEDGVDDVDVKEGDEDGGEVGRGVETEGVVSEEADVDKEGGNVGMLEGAGAMLKSVPIKLILAVEDELDDVAVSLVALNPCGPSTVILVVNVVTDGTMTVLWIVIVAVTVAVGA